MSSVYPSGGGGDAAYPPPNPALYTNPHAGAPPSIYPAAATNMQMPGITGFQQQLTYEWGAFSTSGMDLLNGLDMVKITKLFDAESAVSYIDTPRKFSVITDGTQQMLSLIENEQTFSTPAHYRSFEVDAFDAQGTKVFTIIREETKYCSYCCFCCACFGDGCKTQVKVRMNDRDIGSINQNCSFNSAQFTIYREGDYDGEELVKVEGATACCRPATHFGLRYPKESSASGSFKKTGYCFGGVSNNYELNFPIQSNAELKALCIAAVVLFAANAVMLATIAALCCAVISFS